MELFSEYVGLYPARVILPMLQSDINSSTTDAVWSTHLNPSSAKTCETRKCLLTLSLAKPRQKAEVTLKTYELFIYGDIRYSANSFCT